ncbi:hypothetical protein JMN32_25620 [Fulvivirga sp. 29W222]|uniref:ATP-grasp domain-containing protein n=1 Tax=Fulvivirga marina TaxID=2494733 RepID=A0A937G499_9BACT|nr:hypothetical protein [Fulvivirga marina]MBL6449715.1 hypothetical protein [Fulvivirga marina]
MSWFNRLWRSNFLIRVRSWEYWPFEIVYLPIFGYWAWLSIKARSMLFFTASNPGIENGGLLGESKYKILTKIPSALVPKTFYFRPKASIYKIVEKMKDNGLSFPIICKPDIGERGWRVEKITDTNSLKTYSNSSPTGFIVQEYIDLPVEAGVFYYKHPQERHGKVSSVVLKEMLQVTGNGRDALKALILNNDRAKLQWDSLKIKFKDELNTILNPGEVKELISIGNHCKGTKFLNGNHIICDELENAYDSISNQIDGFFYGRFDLRAASLEDIKAGKVKIMELNGAGAEPSHIYHPGFSLREGYRVLFHHWKVLYQISTANHKLGVPYLSVKQGWSEYKRIKAIK